MLLLTKPVNAPTDKNSTEVTTCVPADEILEVLVAQNKQEVDGTSLDVRAMC